VSDLILFIVVISCRAGQTGIRLKQSLSRKSCTSRPDRSHRSLWPGGAIGLHDTPMGQRPRRPSTIPWENGAPGHRLDRGRSRRAGSQGRSICIDRCLPRGERACTRGRQRPGKAQPACFGPARRWPRELAGGLPAHALRPSFFSFLFFIY
jgi:hypothetical protein